MKKIGIFVLAVLAASIIPLSATDPRAQTVPTIRIESPESIAPGDEVTIEVTVFYRNVDKNNHIMYIWLYENYRRVKVWTWTEDNIFNQEEFTLTYTTVLTEDTVFFVYAKSTIHGSSGTTAYIEVQPLQ